MMRKNDIAKKIDPLPYFAQRDLVRMEGEKETFMQKTPDRRKKRNKLNGIIMQDDEIVRIPNIRPGMQCFLCEMIERIHIYVRKELRRQVSDRDALNSLSLCNSIHSLIAPDDGPQKSHRFRARDPTGQHIQQCPVIHAVKKFPYITFEHPAGAGPILADFARKALQAVHSRMRPLPNAAGIRIEDERTVEKRAQYPMDRMVHNTVAHAGFVDYAMLGVEDMELFVRPVAISAGHEVVMQGEQSVFHMPFEHLNIGLTALSSAELAPCGEKIL